VTGKLFIENCRERLRGLQAALWEFGVPFDPALVREADFQFSGDFDQLSYLLGKNATAVFCFNDTIAYGILRQMRNYSLRVPDDLSLVGFDDLVFSDLTEPPLTTLSYPVEAMAAAVVEGLLRKIEGKPDAGAKTVFDPVLKVKGSTRRLG